MYVEKGLGINYHVVHIIHVVHTYYSFQFRTQNECFRALIIGAYANVYTDSVAP